MTQMFNESVEMSAEEAKLLRGSKTLMDQLLKNPKTRRDAEKLVKTLYPDTTTTDDLAAPYVEEIKSVKAELEEFKKSRNDEKMDAKLNAQLDQLRADGYTDEGLEKIKELMVKESLPNALAAAAFWEKLNPKTVTASSAFQPTDWGFGRKTDDADLKLLFDDEDAWADREARKAWDDEVRKKGQILT